MVCSDKTSTKCICFTYVQCESKKVAPPKKTGLYWSGSCSSSASWCSTVCTTKHPVRRRPLPVCLQCCLQTTSLLCQPRSSRRASPSSQQLRLAAFSVAGAAIENWLSGHQQRLLQAFTEDVFYFQLTRVHSTLELFGRCALQIYLLTYLLTY